MSFNIANLALQTYANDRGIYFYVTTDTLATVKASAYFGQDSTTGQQSSDMLNANDLILVQASDGHVILRVDTVSGNTVTTEMSVGESQWMTISILDLSTQGGFYLAAPFDGVVGRVKLTTNGEVDTTTVVTLKLAGVLITGLSISLDQSGQGAGEVYEAASTALNTVSEGTAVQVSWDGATTAKLHAIEADVMVQVEFLPV